MRVAASKAAGLASYPACAILAFTVLSRLTVGRWLVAGGFFDVDPSTYRHPLTAGRIVWLGIIAVNGQLTTALGVSALAAILWSATARRRSSHLLVVLALGACVSLPLYAFWNGHPFRVRYLVPSTMALAAMTGIAVGLLPRRGMASAAVVALALVETPPLSVYAPMVVEAQRDADLVAGRRRLTECLMRSYDRTPILASMGSLAPYMQETAAAGLAIRDYIHEGIGGLWKDSLVNPGRHTRWILIEEEAEGGDVLARLSRRSPQFLAGFDRFCEGGGVALFRRTDVQAIESPEPSEPGGGLE